MNRPLLLRIAPDDLRLSIWSRLYRKSHQNWLPLFQSANLRFAPSVTMELVPGDLLSNRIAFTGIHEIELTRRALTLGQQGGTLVDIGANLGYFSLLWTTCNPNNRSIAIEASPRNVEILRRNVERNGLSDRIQIIPCAAGASAGKFKFDLGPEEQRGWGGLALNEGTRTIEVDVIRLDEVVRIDDPIRMLKVDTEGADTWALMGCERILRAGNVQEIWFEENRTRMKQLGIASDAAQLFLESVGYVARAHGNTNANPVEWSAVRMQ